jgi:hypothetical protein
MILIDPNEAPYLPSALMQMQHRVLSSLEERTGADIVLSVWEAPVTTDSLAWQHVRRGVGYQLKRGEDLVASIKDGRAMYQLARMLTSFSECWGVWIGVPAAERYQGIDMNLAGLMFPYKAYLSHVRNWQRAGGMWLELDPICLFERWVEDELKRMSTDEPSRLLRKPQVNLLPLTPQEETLATFPMLGPTRARSIWNHMKAHDVDRTLTQALVWLSDGFATRVEGIGKGVVKAARRHLGLREHEELGLYTDNDFLKPVEKGGGDE